MGYDHPDGHETYEHTAFSFVRKHSNNKDDLKELENKYPGMKITITESQEPIGS